MDNFSEAAQYVESNFNNKIADKKKNINGVDFHPVQHHIIGKKYQGAKHGHINGGVRKKLPCAMIHSIKTTPTHLTKKSRALIPGIKAVLPVQKGISF